MKKATYIIWMMLLLLILSGCRTTKTIETVREVYKTRTDTVRDSIYHDVFRNVWIKGDTIHEQTTEYVYKDRWRTHTDTLIRCDTVTQVLTVKEGNGLTWWSELKLKTWSFLCATSIIAFVCLIISFKKK